MMKKMTMSVLLAATVAGGVAMPVSVTAATRSKNMSSILKPQISYIGDLFCLFHPKYCRR